MIKNQDDVPAKIVIKTDNFTIDSHNFYDIRPHRFQIVELGQLYSYHQISQNCPRLTHSKCPSTNSESRRKLNPNKLGKINETVIPK